MSRDRLDEGIVREERPIAVLVLVMALIFVASFAIFLGVPGLPLHVHHRFAGPPSLPPSIATASATHSED